MIRFTFLIIFSFFLTFAFAQSRIKVRKGISQDKMTTVVTLSGLYYGDTTCAAILRAKKLKLSQNSKNYKILYFETTISENGRVYNSKNDGDSLNAETTILLQNICSKKLKNAIRLFISPIVALDKTKSDTIYLNPIEIKLATD